MSLCAIIVSYRTGPSLAACIEALKGAAGLDEAVLVDNGNGDAETAALDAFAADPRVRLLRGLGNIGFAAACNLAARAAASDVLVFVNPDAILDAGALQSLARALEDAPPPAIVGGDLRDPGGNPERGSRRERVTLWRAFVYATGLARLERLSPLLRDFNRHRDPVPAAPVRVGAVSGALLAMRRADFDALGGFDEGYFVHVEDLDLCRRAEQAGWPVLFAPGPHGVHVRSTSAADASFIARHKARGMARYLNKFARGPIDRALAGLAGAVLMFFSR
ncbi:MAG: glycosyltransferase family 2 protein [Phycisphaerales bacterium]|nr:glycosyltransferase family 2 protein [Hyphomonadaceae bacterium]